MPTHDNPADLASKGEKTIELWWNGPEWLSDEKNWPPSPVTSMSVTSEEVTVIREVLNTAQTKKFNDDMDQLLKKP